MEKKSVKDFPKIVVKFFLFFAEQSCFAVKETS